MQSDVLTLFEEERFELTKAEGFRKLGVVPELRMGIEREMGTVNSEVVIEKPFQKLITFTRPRMRRSPEKAVMNDQKVGTCFDCFGDGCCARIYGGRYPADGAVVLHLQAICRTRPVGELLGFERSIAVFDDGAESPLFHVMRRRVGLR